MLKFISFILIVSFAAVTCYAVEKFEPIYRDASNGLSWSKGLPSVFSNGCVDTSGKYSQLKCTFETLSDGSKQVKTDDSIAAQACEKIGARLPTMSEFESLIRKFDHIEETYTPSLTAEGNAEMQNVFGDMKHMNQQTWFWSSSVYGDDNSDARTFFADNGSINYGYSRNTPLFVRCVSR